MPPGPILKALNANSTLRAKVQTGLAALPKAHKDYVQADVRTAFVESLDLDAAMRDQHPQDNRWDYLLGLGMPAVVVALEPHSAKSDEVTTVITKKQQAERQLGEHLKPGARVGRWYWVASGKVHFAPSGKEPLRLAKAGITFVGTRLQQKHLPTG